MPRTYKRKPGSRHYADYSAETLQKCLAAVKAGEISTRKAEADFGVPRRTIMNKLRGNHSSKPGKPAIFNEEEEKIFSDCVIQMSDFGFPVDEFELRCIISSYLSRIGRKVKQFSNNFPGKDWVRGFLSHPHLTIRFAKNIKKARASINKETLTDYIENLNVTLEGVPPENVWNYDESNLSDDPGSKRVITKRGVKYPENIRNSSKASVSIMMSGSAVGELLPPYVVYRSQNMWSTWQEGGPSGCRYNNSQSGWFTAEIFTDWFQSLMLPKLKKLEGKKVLIGDNLSSHITEIVLKLCRENDIYFVCLPPNSTHLTQPLDVAFFGPFKSAWRKILGNYKESEAGIHCSAMQKQHFPALLKELMIAISGTSADNLKNGFRKSGIYPCDVNELLARLPGTNSTCDRESLEGSFKDFLSEKRSSTVAASKRMTKKRKINVPAGKSICHEVSILDLEIEAGPSNMEDNPATIKKRASYKHVLKKTLPDCETDEDDSLHESSSSPFGSEEETDNPSNPMKLQPVQKVNGEFVIFTYEGEIFLGKILQCKKKAATISSMQRTSKAWKWPTPVDVMDYSWNNVLGSISPPKPINNRGFFKVKELQDTWF